MTTGGTTAYRLRDRGHDLQVHTDVQDGRNRARLLVDDHQVGEESTKDEIGSVRLEYDGRLVRVGWWWRGRVGSVVLLDPPEKDGAPDPDWSPSKEEWGWGRKALRTPFEPPPQTRAHRTWQWRTAHPDLYAARHVAVQLLSLAAGVLGLNLLVNWVLGWLLGWDLFGWLPDWSLPDLPDLFGWLPNIPQEWNPAYWIGRLVQWIAGLLDFLPDGLGRFWPIVVAVLVALGEIDRRRKRDAREQAAEVSDVVRGSEGEDRGENR